MIPRLTPYEDSPPLRDNIITVAMPGITSTRSQISRYTGSEGVKVLRNWNDLKLDLSKPGNNTIEHYDVERDFNRHHKRSLWLKCRYAIQAFRHGRAEDVTVAVSEDGGGLWTPHTASSAERGDTEEGDASVDPPFLYRTVCRVAPRLLHNVVPSPEVTETVYRRWYLTVNPIHWALTLKDVMTSLLFHVRPIQPRYCEIGATNLAGHGDQRAMQREVRRAVRHIQHNAAPHCRQSQLEKNEGGCGPSPKKKHLVMFGCSRGATTCFYTAMKLPVELAAYVSLVVVEAPFDTLEHVIRASSWWPTFNLRFFKAFCDYRGRADELAAFQFDPTQVHIRCPVAFVLSTKDSRVPNECTEALISRVRDTLVPLIIPAVEVLVLKHSRHPCMAVGHKEDQDAYVRFMEGLYDKYCT